MSQVLCFIAVNGRLTPHSICSANGGATGTGSTVTGLHAEQLLPSLLSTIVPTIEALLSAHTRTYMVPAVAKVCGIVIGSEVPAESTGLVNTPITVAPAPPALVAAWNTPVNVVTVEAFPLFVTTEESPTSAPAVTFGLVTLAAVRSGIGGLVTVTAVHAEQLSDSLLSTMVPTIEVLLSAQARTNFVPPEVNVYKRVDGPD